MSGLIVGTRGSPLALAQTELIKGMLLRAHPDLAVTVKIIQTSGDRFQQAAIAAAGGKGLFTREIEDQLQAGTVDLAIHSLKDLPTELPDGLTLGAVPCREDARDVLILKQRGSGLGAATHAPLARLPAGATIATSSIRRQAQLLAARPDLCVVPIRGNLDTRLRKLGENDGWTATMLAAAGLNRLRIHAQWPQYHWHPLPVDVMIPAVGQGAIGVEVRADDFTTQELLAAINDADTLACVEAERVFLRAMGGGCQLPFAAHAAITGKEIHLVAAAFSEDGRSARRAVVTGPVLDPHGLGARAATELRAGR